MSDLPTESTMEEKSKAKGSGGIGRWMMIGVGGLIFITLILFVIALLGGISDSAGVGNFFRILRDLFIVILALQGTLICVALMILISQFAALINILSSEVQPIIEEAQETVSTARGTADFVSKNVAQPVIKVTSTAVGVGVFLRELAGIRRNISGRARK